MAKSALFTVHKNEPCLQCGLNLLFGPGNTARFSVVHTIRNVIMSVP